MPTKRQVFEKLRFELGAHPENGEQKAFYADVEHDQAERIKNNKRKTRFVLCTDDPDLCSQFEFEKNRIFTQTRDKSVMLHLMIRAWQEALSESQIAKILAQLEGPDAL